MRVALIPPVSRLADTQRTDIQLLLPHMLQTNAAYRKWYSRLSNPILNQGQRQHFILDNGAAESIDCAYEDLYECACVYANELALPDVLHDRVATVVKSRHFLDWYVKIQSELEVDLGYVAQGNTPMDAFKGVEAILGTHSEMISIIYIPRHLVTRFYMEARIELAKLIHAWWPELIIHFFGMNQLWPGEIISAARKVPFVRSVDTSMPYQFAWHTEPMRMVRSEGMKYISRPDNYFDISSDSIHTDRNINKILRWANGEPKTPISAL